MPEYFKAIESFAYTDKSGIPQIVRSGDVVGSDYPGLKNREHLFEPVEASVNRATRARSGKAVETASAAPGEKRTRSRRVDEPKTDDVKDSENA